jgi:hypothetical protein
MEKILNLKYLEDLRIEWTPAYEPYYQIPDYLTAVGLQFEHLNRLELKISSIESPLDYKIVECLKYFKNLKFLNLFVKINFKNYEISDKQLEESEDKKRPKITSFLFKDCKQLTHICLYFHSINDEFFEDIDLHLPQLKHLNTSVCDITDRALHSLTKLKKLEKIKFIRYLRPYHCFKYPFITDKGVCDLINNCSQLKSINFSIISSLCYLDSNTKIYAQNIINDLIALALRKPKIYFNHYFKNFDTYLDLHKDYYIIPKNLQLLPLFRDI